MRNDASRMQNDLISVVTTLAPEVPVDKLLVRLEEVLYRYTIEHKAAQLMENDIAEKISLFLSSKTLEGLSENTIEDYQIELNLFDRSFKKSIIQIQTPDIRSYLASLQNVQTSTLGKKLSVLKSFFGWLVQEEILLRDPTSKVKLPKKAKRLPKGLTIQELEWIREMCKSKRERALVEVLYSTGCRLSEIANMNISDIDFSDMSTTVVGKGNKERRVFFTHMAMYHLKSYLNTRSDNCDAVFVTLRRPIRRMHNHTIADVIDDIEQRCALTKNLTPHVFRHSLAQHMLDNGATLEEVQHVLGHENLSTTQIYAHISEERKQAAHKKYA